MSSFAEFSPSENPAPYNGDINKRDRNEQTRARRLDALAKGETNIQERLLAMRGELGILLETLDLLTLPVARPPRMIAGLSAGHSVLPRSIADLVAFRQRRAKS